MHIKTKIPLTYSRQSVLNSILSQTFQLQLYSKGVDVLNNHEYYDPGFKVLTKQTFFWPRLKDGIQEPILNFPRKNDFKILLLILKTA